MGERLAIALGVGWALVGDKAELVKVSVEVKYIVCLGISSFSAD